MKKISKIQKRPYSHSKTNKKKMTSIRLDPGTRKVWGQINKLLIDSGLPKKSQSEIIEEASIIYLQHLKNELDS